MKQSLLILTLTLLSFSACAHDTQPTQDHISVVGIGQVEQAPDQAILSVSVNAQQATLPAAKKLADDRYRNVLAVLKNNDIDDKHVKATQIMAQPQYEWHSNKRVYKGELVTRTLSITINDLDKVSPLMQQLVENEVSTINSLNTDFQDRASLMQEALGAAADNAKQKAAFLAKRLGRELGSAYLISEHNVSAPVQHRPEMMMKRSMSMDAAPPPPEMFGTQTIEAQVNVSFNLL